METQQFTSQTERIDWDLLPKLYGREEQEEALTAAYNRRRKRTKPEFVLITGVSGSGKSALARSIRKRVEDDWGFFVSGKFDQYQIPHAPFVAAAEEIAKQVRLRGDHVLESVRDAIQDALGPELFILLEVIPMLKDILVDFNSSQRSLAEDESRSFSDDSGFKINIEDNLV